MTRQRVHAVEFKSRHRAAIGGAILLGLGIALTPSAAARPWRGDQRAADNDATDEESDAIRALLNRLNNAVADRQAMIVESSFDFVTMARAVHDTGLLPSNEMVNAPQLADDLQVGMAQVLVEHADALRWSRQEIRGIEKISARERLVITRAWDIQGRGVNSRWWLRQSAGEWRIYDMEQIHAALRLSTVFRMASMEADGDETQLLDDYEHLQTAEGLLADDELYVAEHALEELAVAEFPGPIETVRLLMLATAQLGLELFTDALATIDRVDEIGSDVPVRDLYRAVAWNGLGDHAAALRAGGRYAALVGASADVNLQMGTAHLGLDQREEAIRFFRAALDDSPDSVENLVALGQALPPEKARLIGPHFRALAAATTWFDFIASEWLDTGNIEAVEALIVELRRLSPDDPNLEYYRARVAMARGEYERAAELLLDAIPRVLHDQEQSYYVELYLDVMIELGRTVEAYEEADDPEFAFSHLAETLQWKRDAATLRSLIAARRAEGFDDAEIHYWEVEAGWIDHDHLAVVTLLNEHRASLLETDERLFWFEDRLIRSLHRLGRHDEVLKLALAVSDRDDDPWWEVLAHAALDDHMRAIDALEAFFDLGYDPTALYRDPDIGPLLMTPPYDDLRRRHPPPEQAGGKDGIG